MKATLKFDLNEIDDRLAHMAAVKSQEMGIIFFEIMYNLKKKCETRAAVDRLKDVYDGIDIVFDEIRQLMEEYNIKLDEITR